MSATKYANLPYIVRDLFGLAIVLRFANAVIGYRPRRLRNRRRVSYKRDSRMSDVQAGHDRRPLTTPWTRLDRRESLRTKIKQAHRAGARTPIHQRVKMTWIRVAS